MTVSVGGRAIGAMRCGLCVVAICCSALLGSAPAASAQQFDITSFRAYASDADGNPETQAGAHPFSATTAFKLSAPAEGLPKSTLKEVRFKLPQGFVGNPESLPKCARDVFAEVASGRGSATPCPIGSQVGTADIDTYAFGHPITYTNYPIYVVEPADGNVAEVGFPLISVPVFVKLHVDGTDRNQLLATITRSSDAIPVTGVKVTLWGTPADSSHDPLRACGGLAPMQPCASDQPQRPFLTNPASCGLAQTTLFTLNSWQHQDQWRSASDRAPDLSGCDRLRFKPGLSISTETTAPDAPTGLSVELDLPQADDPESGLAAPPLKDARVTLPEGMTINPASAGGLRACSDAELGLKTERAVRCPDASKIGSASAVSPLLATPLQGSLFVRSQASSDPASGEMFRIVLVLRDERRGLLFKLPGQVRANRETGRLETSFVNNPELPVSRIRLDFKSGPRAPLVTPPDCGTRQAAARLSSWAGQSAALTAPVSVVCTSGLGGFAPGLSAFSTNPIAAASSPFALQITKRDGDRPLRGLRMDLPAGLVARLKGNVGRQVGSVTAFAGPGSNPYALPGRVYLEGRYQDAPFSLRVVVPAKAGPFDLGEVVVRQKIYVNPKTAAVTIVSDPFPTIVGGVPVRLQRLNVSVDKPGFMINPTSCAAKSVGGRLWSAAGQTAAVKVRFQVGDCARLAVRPKLAMRLTGDRRYMKDNRRPGLKAILTQKGGLANLKRVMVRLPLALALEPDNAVSDDLCPFRASELTDPRCPKSSIVGRAEARSPILNKPMRAPVYFAKYETYDRRRKKMRKRLPRLIIPFRGENGLKLNVIGSSHVTQDKLVTTFNALPDAPVSYFKMRLNGGKKGILVTIGNVCKRSRKAAVETDGHNNRAYDTHTTIRTPCAKAKKK